jgi:2'-5' RNA ligase
MRIFISIEIPEKIKDTIEKLIEEMKQVVIPIKWIEKKSLHVTLKFLGWIDDKKIEELADVTSKCVKDCGDFELGFAGIGAFPDLKRPRVIWTGISEGKDRATGLAECLDKKLAKLGYRSEDSDFSPHLTVGRIKDRIDLSALTRFISEKAGLILGSFDVDHISIMKSSLKRSSPVYEEIKRIRLTRD